MQKPFWIGTLALLCCGTVAGWAQETPTELPKKELPAKALCLFCAPQGEGEEPPAAGLRYKGKTYYFCNKSEVAKFKKDPEAAIPPEIPRPVPAFTLKTLDEKEVTADTYRGKVLLIDFWATWCKPCVETMPELQKLHTQYAEKEVVILGVSIDEKGVKAVKPFLAKRKFTYPILLDGGDKPVWRAFGVRQIPALFLVNREGQVVRQWFGKPDKKQVVEALQTLVGSEN